METREVLDIDKYGIAFFSNIYVWQFARLRKIYTFASYITSFFLPLPLWTIIWYTFI